MTVAKCYTHSRQTFVIRIHCLFASRNRVRDVDRFPSFVWGNGSFSQLQNNAQQKQAFEGKIFLLKSLIPVRTNQLNPIMTQLQAIPSTGVFITRNYRNDYLSITIYKFTTHKRVCQLKSLD